MAQLQQAQDFANASVGKGFEWYFAVLLAVAIAALGGMGWVFIATNRHLLQEAREDKKAHLVSVETANTAQTELMKIQHAELVGIIHENNRTKEAVSESLNNLSTNVKENSKATHECTIAIRSLSKKTASLSDIAGQVISDAQNPQPQT